MTAEQSKALRELQATMTERRQLVRRLERLDAVRDRRIMRAVAVGVDRVIVAAEADLSRQRVGQIAAGVEKGAGREQVAVLAQIATPRGVDGVEARRRAQAGGGT